MQTPHSDPVAKSRPPAIEMSAAGKAKWKAMLTARKISTTKKLISRVPEITGESLARRVLNAQSLDRQTWQAIFYALKLDRADFFTDVQWFALDANSQWEMLWELARDSDRFGLVLAESVTTPEDREVDRAKFIQTIAVRTAVFIEIPAGSNGYLILVERDAQNNIVLLSPSPLMASPLLTGAIQRLPQPPSPFPHFQPLSVGTNQLWAGVFDRSPDWRWLADAKTKPLRLQLAQLTDLYVHARKQSSSIPLMRSTYVTIAT
ncbi:MULTISPECIES: hypothetical protein [unclassified Chamaesiphon]|uniref:hypothetical protein n=1 Tax=unclassified Chamaesiphon TaxID=2620921 RepID=UPI00286D1BF4|nr:MULTISPECIES: hypothetical protein [unclassified Chamaesiphon]